MLLAFLLALTPTTSAEAVKTRAAANIASYIADDDYPAEAIRNGEQGNVGFRLDVAADGKVARCTITQSSGSVSLDDTTCRLLTERARFVPARNEADTAVPDVVNGTIRWVLPEEADAQWLNTKLREINNIWEVTADGRQRSCRRELRFEDGLSLHLDECGELDADFVQDAANHLKARPQEVLTIRLDNRWLTDPTLPFPAHDESLGQLFSRAEGDYRLNDDLTVRNCVAMRFSALIDWQPAPCYREDFAGVVPPETKVLRMEVQWVVRHGSDTQRPKQFPVFITRDGEVTPAPVRP